MPAYCEVALPVPLDRTFTYAVREEQQPRRGARVIVPFRNEKLIGVVTAVGVTAPADFEVRYLEAVLDDEPLLSDHLLDAGRVDGAVLSGAAGRGAARHVAADGRGAAHGLLPHHRSGAGCAGRARGDRADAAQIPEDLDDPWRSALRLDAADELAPAAKRGKLSPEEQDLELRVLARLASGEAGEGLHAAHGHLGHAAAAGRLLRKKWIARETAAAERDARRMERFAVLIPEARLPALTANQQAILAELAACGGELPLAELRRKDLPSSTLQTLVRRGLVRIDERPAAFRLGGLHAAGGPFASTNRRWRRWPPGRRARGFPCLFTSWSNRFGKDRCLSRGNAAGAGSRPVVDPAGSGDWPDAADRRPARRGVWRSKVALLHSALTPEERSEQWRRIRRGDAPIVVGTRSAIFAPAPNLGLILVDEEHDQSYKQEETPRYNARDVAVMRAKLEGAVVVMGSATPSLESWQNSARASTRASR